MANSWLCFVAGTCFALFVFHAYFIRSHPGDALLHAHDAPPPKGMYNTPPTHVDENRTCNFAPGYKNAHNGYSKEYVVYAHEVRRHRFHHVRRLVRLVPRLQNRTYLNKYTAEAGDEHYALLCYLSKTLRAGSLVVDVGSGPYGLSSLAMGCNSHVPVFAYDIVSTLQSLSDKHHESAWSIQERLGQIYLVHGDAMSPRNARIVLAASVILLDTHHDPVQQPFEYAFYEFLVRNCFSGLLVVDGIHLNKDMEAFWASIQLKKHDVTLMGRPTGTGIVDFSGWFRIEGDM